MPSTLERWCGSAPLASSSSTISTWHASTATISPVLRKVMSLEHEFYISFISNIRRGGAPAKVVDSVDGVQGRVVVQELPHT
jgi:hypothetical protein